jgi:hypothetical protein
MHIDAKGASPKQIALKPFTSKNRTETPNQVFEELGLQILEAI